MRESIAEIYTGVSAAIPMSSERSTLLWRSTIDATLAADPDLRRWIHAAQPAVLRVEDGQYVAVVLRPQQAALWDGRGRPARLDGGLVAESHVMEQRLMSAAARSASILMEVRDIAERSPDPVREIERIEPEPGAYGELVRAIVRGAPTMELLTESGDVVTLEVGARTRSSVLLDHRVRVTAQVMEPLRGGVYIVRVEVEHGGDTRRITTKTKLRLLVPESLRAASVLLAAACVTGRPVTLVVAMRQSLVGRKVVELMMCAAPRWHAELSGLMGDVVEPPVLTPAEVFEEIATWGRNRRGSENLEPR